MINETPSISLRPAGTTLVSSATLSRHCTSSAFLVDRITPGAAAPDSINTYEFHADEGDRISIEVTSSDGGVCFSLEDPDRQPIERYWPSGEVLEVPALLTGDYTILAGGFCGAVEGVEYTITVEVSD